MGPISLFILNKLLLDSGEKTPKELEPRKTDRLTLIQVKSLTGLNKGSIRESDHGVLALKNGVEGFGKPLHHARFRPGVIKSWKNALTICKEVARKRYGFDLLFIDNNSSADKVSVLCPRCYTYWNWDETLDNNLNKSSDRLCGVCRNSN